MIKKIWKLLLLGQVAIYTATVMAQPSRAYLNSRNLDSSGVAIEGYSPVAYFTHGKAIEGKKQYAVDHENVTYYLASEKEKQVFSRNPDAYLPAFGGWCAFGMAIQDKFPVDPKSFKIVDGRLFLFLKNSNVDALKLWKDGKQDELVKKAESHWKKVKG